MDVDGLINELEKFDRREVVYPTGSPGETRLMRSAVAALRELRAENERLREQINALLNHCPDAECSVCAEIICPHKDIFHFHHDGCPSCYFDERDKIEALAARGE